MDRSKNFSVIHKNKYKSNKFDIKRRIEPSNLMTMDFRMAKDPTTSSDELVLLCMAQLRDQEMFIDIINLEKKFKTNLNDTTMSAFDDPAHI